MDAPDKISTERSMHSPVPRDAAHICELSRPDSHIEMSLATFAPTAMATMAFAVILDHQQIGRKGCLQPLFDFITNSHLLSLGSSNL